MKLTFYTIAASVLPYEEDEGAWLEEHIPAQFGIKFVVENVSDCETQAAILEWCEQNRIWYTGDHVRFNSAEERMEFALKWF